MDKCLFCQIAKHQIPAQAVLETNELIAFPDINPKTPVHILIIPKSHIVSVQTASPNDALLIGRLILAAQTIAQKMGCDQTGYRLVFNTRGHAGGEIDHLHLHLLAGHPLGRMG